MDIGVVSMRYAKALLQFAKINKEEDLVYAEMQTLAQSYIEVVQLRSVLLNPTMPADKKHQILSVAAAGDRSLSVSSDKFFSLVIKRQRVECMQFMANSYITLYREEKNLTHGRLITAQPVSEKTIERMKQLVNKLTHKSVDFDVELDKSIKAGFILEYGTYRMDASLKSQLSRMRRELSSAVC